MNYSELTCPLAKKRRMDAALKALGDIAGSKAGAVAMAKDLVGHSNETVDRIIPYYNSLAGQSDDVREKKRAVLSFFPECSAATLAGMGFKGGRKIVEEKSFERRGGHAGREQHFFNVERAGVFGLSKTPAGKVQKPCVFLSSKAHIFF